MEINLTFEKQNEETNFTIVHNLIGKVNENKWLGHNPKTCKIVKLNIIEEGLKVKVALILEHYPSELKNCESYDFSKIKYGRGTGLSIMGV